MKHVVIINGKPESGKTTFERECRDHLNELEYAHCHIFSSINYIKDVYKKLGWDGKMTEKARKELSILKKMWSEKCNGSIRYAMKTILGLDDTEDHVIFINIREEDEIIELSEVLQALYVLNIKCTKLLITRPECDLLEYGNKSDDMVGTNVSIYDKVIKNNTTIEELYEKAYDFIDTLFTN